MDESEEMSSGESDLKGVCALQRRLYADDDREESGGETGHEQESTTREETCSINITDQEVGDDGDIVRRVEDLRDAGA